MKNLNHIKLLNFYLLALIYVFRCFYDWAIVNPLQYFIKLPSLPPAARAFWLASIILFMLGTYLLWTHDNYDDELNSDDNKDMVDFKLALSFYAFFFGYLIAFCI